MATAPASAIARAAQIPVRTRLALCYGFASRFGVSIMPFVRAVAALVAAVVLCSTAALAETMPVMPEGGKDTTATLPALPGMANKGEGPGGVDAARMEKSCLAPGDGVECLYLGSF